MRPNKSLFGGRRLFRVCLFVAVGVGLAPSAEALAQGRGRRGGSDVVPKTSPRFLAPFREAVTRASQSTLRVQADGKDVALGVVVGADGWVLTKADDLVEEDRPALKGKTVCKLRDGRELEARLVGCYRPYDLALLKVDAEGLTPVEWKPGKNTPAGHWVVAAGVGADPVAVGVVGVAARTVKLPSSGYLGVMLAPV